MNIDKLSAEALGIGSRIIQGSYTNTEFYSMMDRLHRICAEIGGSPRELLSNAQLQLEKGQR
jgi:hypothetical protein